MLIGDVKQCSKEEVASDGLPELYKSKHPNAFWADFGDFTYFRMTDLKQVNFVGGFARAGTITLASAQPNMRRNYPSHRHSAAR